MGQNMNCLACGGLISIESPVGTLVRCPLCNATFTVGAPMAPPTVVSPAVTGRPPRQGLAVAALICGIGGLVLCPLVGIVGLVMGIVALLRANRDPREYGGKGLAIGGICTGAISMLLFPLMIAILLPSLSRARELSKRLVCSANMAGINSAMQTYQMQFRSPPPDLQALLASGLTTPRQLVCPSSKATPSDSKDGYVLVTETGAKPRMDDVVIYEKRENHGGEGANVLFGDGHVEFVKPYTRVEELVKRTRERAAAAREASP
jgi:prepilin-type processing-associated H-X9-DG protein